MLKIKGAKIHFLLNTTTTGMWYSVIVTDKKGVPIAVCNLGSWNQSCVFLSNLCVQEPFRNKGVGTWILKRCIEKCKDNDKKCLTLVVNKANVKAIKLYELLGLNINYESETEWWMSIATPKKQK